MSPRIRELAKQAGMESADFPYDEFGMPWEQKKFAELIVRECVSVILLDSKTIADAMPDANRDNYTMVAEQTGMINGSMRYADKIKQHFGVEE